MTLGNTRGRVCFSILQKILERSLIIHRTTSYASKRKPLGSWFADLKHGPIHAIDRRFLAKDEHHRPFLANGVAIFSLP
jgi:hypothetical protein